MVKNLEIGNRPIGFKFYEMDIVKIDEKKNTIVLADTLNREYKDTIDDASTPEGEAKVVINNTFPTIRYIHIPYREVVGSGGLNDKAVQDSSHAKSGSVLEYIKEKIKNNQTIRLRVEASVDFLSDSKITCYNVQYFEID